MSVLRALAEIRVPFLDSLLLGISMLGTPVFVVGVIAWFYWNVDRQKALMMGASFCLSGTIGQSIKLIARIPRPWNLDTSFRPVESAISTATGYSFPSIHAQSTASFAASIWYFYRKKSVRVFAVLYLAVIVFTRMYLGVHTPLDVAVGSVLGLVFSFGSLSFLSRQGGINRKNAGTLSFFLIAFALVLIVLGAVYVANGTVTVELAKDGFETAGCSIGFAIVIPADLRVLLFDVSGTMRDKLFRLLLGLAGAGVIEFGLKALFGSFIPMLVVRYILIMLWLFTATPAIGMRIGIFKKAARA